MPCADCIHQCAFGYPKDRPVRPEIGANIRVYEVDVCGIDRRLGQGDIRLRLTFPRDGVVVVLLTDGVLLASGYITLRQRAADSMSHGRVPATPARFPELPETVPDRFDYSCCPAFTSLPSVNSRLTITPSPAGALSDAVGHECGRQVDVMVTGWGCASATDFRRRVERCCTLP